MQIIAVITADIVNSRIAKSPEDWQKPLKECLSLLGPSPEKWEIFRGDSFQVEIEDPAAALLIALHLKAIIKTQKELDLRLAIGLGDKTYKAKKITESNGSAFVRSGEAFERIRKTTAMVIATEWKDLDEIMNLSLKLASVIMSGWKPATAEIVSAYLNSPQLSQEQLARQLGMKQPSISAALSRASYYELMELVSYYRRRIQQLTDQ